MAKKKSPDEGLPYFKFFISKWSTGNIQQCSLSSQGLFINLCGLYWGQRGELYFSKMKKRFQRKQKHFEELLSEDVIKLIGDKIEITFLDEQLQELGFVSEKNRENALLGWNKRKQDATASISQSDRNANAMPREEKREEEKRKEENKNTDAQISSEDFKYEFVEEKIVPREASDLAQNILDYFSASKDVMSPIFTKVENFIAMVFHRGEFQKLKTSFEKYKTYKARSQEQIHGIEKWMGTVDEYFKDGHWYQTDWERKLNSYEQQSTKGTSRTTSSQVSGTQYGTTGGF